MDEFGVSLRTFVEGEEEENAEDSGEVSGASASQGDANIADEITLGAVNLMAGLATLFTMLAYLC